jgi:hypothetical protein
VGFQAVGEAAEGGGQFVAWGADVVDPEGLAELLAAGAGLGLADLLGDLVAGYLLVFGDHFLAPLTLSPC